MLKRILAVSGGVDSMVMLDFFVQNFLREELVVATFDHESRESSAKDAEFVSEISSALEIPVYMGRLGGGMEIRRTGEMREGRRALSGEEVSGRGELSEAEARRARYEFLFKVAFLEKGEIYLAQHLDDLVESVAINCLRGTGGRGLAVMGRVGARRPFLDERLVAGAPWGRKEILRYAAERRVRFRLDPSNYSERYLRNRIRGRVGEMDREDKLEMFELWQRQREIYREIDKTIENLIPEDLRFSREMFREVPEEVGREILRAGLLRAGVRATGPQVEEFRRAILDYKTGKKFNLPGGKMVEIKKREFQIKV